MQLLSLAVPVYNEARTLRPIFDRITRVNHGMDIEVLFVDDGSTDRSWDVLEDLARGDGRVRLFRHDTNRGKGAAIRTALAAAEGEIFLIQDADLEYDPGEIRRLIRPIVEGAADVVIGSRFAAGSERKVLFYWHAFGNKLITLATNILNDINLTDVMSGYKAVRLDVLRNLRLTSDGFGIETELVTRLAQWGAVIYEVPISYHGRSYAEGKKARWKHGVIAITQLFSSRFIDRRFTHRGGHDTLESLGTARALNRWILDQFKAHLGDRVLEAGCGTGNMTKLLLDRRRLVSVDIDQHYCERIRRRYGHLTNLRIEQVDLSSPSDSDRLGNEEFDSIISINVLEHIEDDAGAVRLLGQLLVPNGTFLILVPAHQDLFSAADRAMGHHRRYDEDQLRVLLESNGFEVQSIRPFNRLGVVGWRFNQFLGRAEIAPWQARVYGLLVPLARFIDRLGMGRGLSLVAVARRGDGERTDARAGR